MSAFDWVSKWNVHLLQIRRLAILKPNVIGQKQSAIAFDPQVPIAALMETRNPEYFIYSFIL